MASVIFALGIAWAPVVVLVSAVSGVLAAAVDLTAVDVPGVPAVARVFAVLPSLLLLISCYCCFKVSVSWMLLGSQLFWASLVLLV